MRGVDSRGRQELEDALGGVRGNSICAESICASLLIDIIVATCIGSSHCSLCLLSIEGGI